MSRYTKSLIQLQRAEDRAYALWGGYGWDGEAARAWCERQIAEQTSEANHAQRTLKAINQALNLRDAHNAMVRKAA